MKKLIPIFALFVLSLTARAGDTSLIGKAMSDNTINACVQAAKQPNTQILSSVDTTGICFVSGETKAVTFYAQLKCTGNGTCPAAASVLVARAEFGCNGELVSAVCF